MVLAASDLLPAVVRGGRRPHARRNARYATSVFEVRAGRTGDHRPASLEGGWVEQLVKLILGFPKECGARRMGWSLLANERPFQRRSQEFLGEIRCVGERLSLLIERGLLDRRPRQMQRLLREQVGDSLHVIHGPTSDAYSRVDGRFTPDDAEAVRSDAVKVHGWCGKYAALITNRHRDPVPGTRIVPISA